MIPFVKRGKVKISTKVVLSFIAIVLFQGLLTQIGMYFLISRSNIDSFRGQMSVVTENVDSFMLQVRDDLDNKVSLLSGQKNVIEYTEFRLRNLLRRELSLFNKALDLNGIFVFVDSGNLLALDESTTAPADEALLEIVSRAFRQGLQSFLHDDGTGLFLWSMTQIVREEQVIGLIGARVAIDGKFLGRLERNSNSIAYVQYPTRSVHSSTLKDEQWSRLLKRADTMSMRDITIADDYLLGLMPLESLGAPHGRLLCLLDMGESRKNIRDYNRFAVVLTVLVLSIALMLSILFYRQSFLRPYTALQEGVARIGNGEFSYPIQQTSGDEFGDLVKSVNRMRINLQNRDRELTALANYNELILNNVRSGIITVGHDGMINACNAAATSMVHLDGENSLPLDLEMAVLPQEVKDLIRQGIYNGEYVALKECRFIFNGREEILNVSTSPFSDGEGEELGVIAVISDITQIKKLEEQLLVSQRLAAIGEMVAGVAHQIRNPLAIMKVSAEMLRDNYGQELQKNSEQYSELTRLLVSEIDSLNYILQNFLDFARPLQINRASCYIEDIIESALSLLPIDKHPAVTVKVDIEPGIPARRLDKDLMEQVVRNLVQNALEAGEEGLVLIQAGYSNDSLRISVSDQGCGMDQKTIQNVFNPFFTLKNKGTGLGLSIVHRIVQEHNGSISVDSTPGMGTTFTVII
ncbi:ATP-binding protein [Marispirochaeta sp.]|uniref:sensor histidine kinase n=1 Tax=Marispirochaeta sp. TaxID=2038653 RepID=UPI0029C6E61F|nr:ATP-binding protein [Marispirochaeta sp.]